ncbi:MAG: hypothetical protein ACKVPX_18940 [Myxococcaceae bacterium]
MHLLTTPLTDPRIAGETPLDAKGVAALAGTHFEAVARRYLGVETLEGFPDVSRWIADAASETADVLAYCDAADAASGFYAMGEFFVVTNEPPPAAG